MSAGETGGGGKGSGMRPDAEPLAVALRYDHAGAPRVTARGRGEAAARILEAAAAHGVPIEEDAALAVALARVEIDEEIPLELYEAVAAVLRFVLGMQR